MEAETQEDQETTQMLPKEDTEATVKDTQTTKDAHDAQPSTDTHDERASEPTGNQDKILTSQSRLNSQSADQTPLLDLRISAKIRKMYRPRSEDGLSQVSLSLGSFRKDSVDPLGDSQPHIMGLGLSESQDLGPGPPSAKDHGYAWVVVFMVFLVNLLTTGFIKSFGITYTLILDYFPDASGAASGWIMGLLVGCRGLLAPAIGALTIIIGPRKCVVIGGLLCFSGFLLAVPAFNIPYLAITLGGIVGTGMCMAETPGFLLITDYFEEKRSLANGFRAAGNPTGGFIFSPLVVILQKYYGLRGTFIILAGIMLQLVVVGMLLRPFQMQEQLIQAKYWKKKQKESEISALQVKKLKPNSVTLKAESSQKPRKAIDFSYLRNPAYIVYLLTMMCSAAALPNAIFFAPLYGRTIGLTDLQNSAIASYTSCCDIVIRILCGFIFNMENANQRYGFILGLLIGGIGCLIVPLCSNMWHLLVFATMYSLCMAFFWTLVNVLLADQFGGEAMASTWGFFRMFQGICNFAYPSLLGLVMDVTGGVSVPYLLMGSLLILGALIFASQPLVAKLPGAKINLS